MTHDRPRTGGVAGVARRVPCLREIARRISSPARRRIHRIHDAAVVDLLESGHRRVRGAEGDARDAARWKYARRFLDVYEVESFAPYPGNDSEDYMLRIDAAIDAAQEAERESGSA